MTEKLAATIEFCDYRSVLAHPDLIEVTGAIREERRRTLAIIDSYIMAYPGVAPLVELRESVVHRAAHEVER